LTTRNLPSSAFAASRQPCGRPAPLAWRTGTWPSRSVVYNFNSPFFGKNLRTEDQVLSARAREGLALELDPRRSDITRRYRTCVGRARCLVMSKTRAFRTSSAACARAPADVCVSTRGPQKELASVDTARASFNYSVFMWFRTDRGG